MRLSELTAYAEKKYNIIEEYKWPDHPGFSVLTDPYTGEWAALLMRQPDNGTGVRGELCDLKCGRQTLLDLPFSYLSAPFLMHGQKWIGVRFQDTTDPKTIFQLFDRAISSGEQCGYTIVLEQPPVQEKTVYGDSALPAYRAGCIQPEETVPERIRKMKKLYEYGSGSFHQKCKNFYLQGMYMQDYEDDYAWNGEIRMYFPTYHDLSVRQLRGYFTWRTRLRKGEYVPAASAFPYLYLYELLNGIGTSSVMESLQKMKEFETKYYDSGIGDPVIRPYVRRWMRDLGIIKGIRPELMPECADPLQEKQDKSLSILRSPEDRTDDEIFEAAKMFAGKHLSSTTAATEKGKQLFARVWKRMINASREEDRDFFTRCFGEPREFGWYPLSNAVYLEKNAFESRDFCLNDCRSYRRSGGGWLEKRYEKLFFNLGLFRSLFHAADARIRRYLKTGHYLREKDEERWAVPCIDAVLEEDRQAEIEAARPKITIDLSGLDRIRRDAAATRDSLLTEEDLEPDSVFQKEEKPKFRADLQNEENPQPPEEYLSFSEPENSGDVHFPGLDMVHSRILAFLLEGKPVGEIIKENHLMPSVTADTINEAFYEEIGDSVVECEDDRLVLVEDYRDEVAGMKHSG